MPIYVDSRGKGEKEISDILISKHYPVELRHVESGDYIIGELSIERKTVSDLINSCVGGDRHLWEQIKIMKNTYKKTLLIIEGYIDWNNKLLVGIIISLIDGWQLPIINTLDSKHTSEILGKLFDRYGTTKTKGLPPPAVIKAKSTREIRWCMLQCVKGIGGVVAKRIIEEIPYIFVLRQDDDPISNPKLTWNKKLSKIKGLNREAKELLIKVLTNG